MTLPAPLEPVHVQSTEDHTLRLAQLHEALRRLRWRKQDGDEHHAERIKREIERLKGLDDG